MTEQKLDTYLDLCTQVYDLSKPTPPEDAYAFYRSYVADAKGAILEPMCGTGRFLLPLLTEGFEVQGFDASQHMLNAMYAKAKLQDLKPTVWKDFVEKLDTPEKYSLIFIPSGSFGLMINSEIAKRALVTLYNHLDHDGILLFEADTLHFAPTQFGVWNGSEWHRTDGKKISLNSLALPIEDYICSFECRYELIDGKNIINTEIETLKFRLYEPEHLTKILKEAGFKNVKIIKAFDRNKTYGINDEVIVCECRKS